MTRTEHLQWAKDRAIELLDGGERLQAFTSMVSDLTKHDDLRDHVAINLGAMLIAAGHMKTDGDTRNWIEGFN